ncbi:ribonuclease H-like domain-containing protein [Tanacetum coccineum]|uniref:Ribonuclease H-like domain-containing protein n=1 Tax=Tanacetum coccineum TaxID=301880 RepID=A0ABQ5CP56_9ASTR
MVTRSQSSIVKLVNRLSLHTSTIYSIPKSPFLTLKDPHWCNAMYDEYNTLVKNSTWILVPRLSGVNLVHSMWLFKHKFHAYGILSRYKARLHTLSCYSAEAEYQGVANIVAETAWLRNMLFELHSPLLTATISTVITLEFYMYPPVISMPISSPRDCPRPCLKNFDPV